MKKDIITIDSRGKVYKTYSFTASKLADIMKKLVEYAFTKEINENDKNNK